MRTYFLKAKDIKKNWLLIDAKGLVLGRLASEVAKILRGKHKASFTPHMDCGDYVIIINAKHVLLTGNKPNRKDGKIYYHHTGYPGGIKETTAGKILEGKFPERVMLSAIKRMMTKNPMRNKVLSNLKIYSDENHPHAAQNPVVYDFASKNSKNINYV